MLENSLLSAHCTIMVLITGSHYLRTYLHTFRSSRMSSWDLKISRQRLRITTRRDPDILLSLPYINLFICIFSGLPLYWTRDLSLCRTSPGSYHLLTYIYRKAAPLCFELRAGRARSQSR